VKERIVGSTSYDIRIEIVEGSACDHHQLGQTFRYPEDIGGICPWLLDSIHAMVRVLQFGGTLPWTYAGTRYEKVIDPKTRPPNSSAVPIPPKPGWWPKSPEGN
jgi:uncharacterized repeat protein (TIGR04076 family)